MAKTVPFSEHDALAIFGFQDAPHDNLSLGIELEYEVKDRFNHREVAREVNEILGDFCLIKRDGSLENGFELNSAPASLTFHKKAWNDFFGHAVRKKLLVSQGNCGLHVHVNRVGITAETVQNLENFIYKEENKKFILDIAGRMPPSDYADLDRKTRRGARYYALNTTSRNTVEFRLFKSTYNKQLFFMRLEFVKALINFCAESKINSFEYKIFINYTLNKVKAYPHLVKFIKESEKWKHIESPSIEAMKIQRRTKIRRWEIPQR